MIENNRYTSTQLQDIFNIKKGSWDYIKKNLKLDDYATKEIDGTKTKFMYDQRAYDILNNNYKHKIVDEAKENPKLMVALQQNQMLGIRLKEMEETQNRIEKLYQKELKEKENLIEVKATLVANNEHLQNENEDLKDEIDRLKHRSLLARIFNK